MFLLFINLIRTNISYECVLPSVTYFTISLFYDKNCENCDYLISFLEELDSRLERNQKNVLIRYKNCDVCDCKDDNLKQLPLVKLSKLGNDLAIIDAKRDFGSIVNVLVQKSGFDKSIFTKSIKTNSGNVVKLKDRDFFSGFSGPWLILFYGSLTDIKRDLIFKIAKEYKNRLDVGEISGNSSPILVRRFSLGYLPAIVALYDGLIVEYNGMDTIEDLRNFVDKLIKPSFEPMTLEKIEILEKSDSIPDPIFIIFYEDINIANEYYRAISHEYKFRSKIYKSNDENLMKKVNINLNDADLKVILYKNKIFHHSPYDATKNNKILEWIWHSHYPMVTKLDNEAYYAIMHGLKPVILLLTHSEDFVEEFEKVSELNHNGMPFSDFIFTTIDVIKYPLFISSLVPKIKVPWIVIYNPVSRLFYTDYMKISKKNVGDIVDSLILKYNTEKLSTYPLKKAFYKRMLLFGFIISFCIYIVKRLVYRNRVKLIEIY